MGLFVAIIALIFVLSMVANIKQKESDIEYEKYREELDKQMCRPDGGRDGSGMLM